MKKPTQDDIDVRVRDIRYYARTELPWGDANRAYIGGAALSEARKYAMRAREWLEKRGLDENGKPTPTSEND